MLVEPTTAVAASHSVSERTYRQLSRVHELMQRQRYAEALAGLDRMRSRVKRKPYENALVLQTYGYIYARQDQYRQAIDALEACLALKAPTSQRVPSSGRVSRRRLRVRPVPRASRWGVDGCHRGPARLRMPAGKMQTRSFGSDGFERSIAEGARTLERTRSRAPSAAAGRSRSG